MKCKPIVIACATLLVSVLPGKCVVIDLWEYVLNVDGTISQSIFGDPLPGGADISAFDALTGLGTISVSVTGAGDHYVGAFFDHNIAVAENGYRNEVGAATGTPVPWQTWEIDEPGYISGDILQNLMGGTLDNAIGSSPEGSTIFPDDVSMAMAWSVTLDTYQMAIVDFFLSDTLPVTSFYLRQSDPDTDGNGTSVYFSGNLRIEDIPHGVPDGGMTISLLAVICPLLWAFRRRVNAR